MIGTRLGPYEITAMPGEVPILAERLESGSHSFNESFLACVQIASAFEEAHEEGIVHRDLKPRNFKAFVEGETRTLDFGLAKAMAVDLSDLGAAAALRCGGQAEGGRPYDPGVSVAPSSKTATASEREWLAEFEAARKRPLEQRMRYAFVRTYKPVLDDARFRSFDSMEQYRDWCRRELPSWLGYGRV